MRLLILLTLLFPFTLDAQTVVTETGRCRVVERHQPVADVAYQPGVDVNGNAVVPADLGGPRVTPPRQIPVRLLVPLTDFVNPAPPFLDAAEIDAGEVMVDRQTGAIFYQGHRLDTAYSVLCEEVTKTPPLPPDPED